MPWTGAPQPLHLPDGTAAFFYPGQGVGWIAGRWQFAVMDETGRPARPDVLLPRVAQLRGDLPGVGNPIGQGTEGQLVLHVGGNPPDMAVLWEDGAYAYEVAAHGVSAIDVSEALVRVLG